MTDREKEIRKKIAEECLIHERSKLYKHDYIVAHSENYNFYHCPDNFDCLYDYMFSAICDEISTCYPCKKCWKYFLEVDLDEKLKKRFNT